MTKKRAKRKVPQGRQAHKAEKSGGGGSSGGGGGLMMGMRGGMKKVAGVDDGSGGKEKRKFGALDFVLWGAVIALVAFLLMKHFG